MKIKEIKIESKEYPIYLFHKIGDKYLKVYYESSYGYWEKREYDNDGNETYDENSNGYWWKWAYDSNGNSTYCENSDGYTRGKKRCNCDTSYNYCPECGSKLR